MASDSHDHQGHRKRSANAGSEHATSKYYVGRAMSD
jgi:hypothetical protein